uniref:Uncharacterized protein n=1 Tax=Tanacetum cinerariifolium TaxID=118510 RepID=A0A699GSY8_TANCI|nr:hypothetical protein [Tanacetum cinerariifolium]
MALAVICLTTGVDTPLFDGMLVQQQVQAVKDAAKDEDDDNEIYAELTPPSPTKEHISSPPQAQTAQPSSPPPQQPSQTAHISQSSMTLLNTLMETCAALTKKMINKMHPNNGKIAELDADEDVTLVDTEEDMNADVKGRLAESQAKPAEVEEVIKVVTAAKLITEVVTTTATTITVTQVPKASAPRRKRGVVIQDPEETPTTSVIVHTKVKSEDKGKGILIEEPKPLKRQAQIKQDEAFAR